jgi:hypothetical protein
MGLFKKIKKKFKKAASVSGVKRIAAGVATGGLSEVGRKVLGKDFVQSIENIAYPTSLKQAITSASVAAAPFTGGASLAVGQAITGKETISTGGLPMNIGNILQGLTPALNTFGSFGGQYGQAAQVGSSLISGFFPASGPSQAQVPQSFSPVLSASMAAAPQIAGAISAGGMMVRSILAKMSNNLGKNITFRAAMIIIRRLAKSLGSPTMVATALGLSAGELAHLITESSLRGSSGRRMNVGNVKALRRAHRRIKSFHKLCGDNDRLRAPRRRTSTKVINVSGRAC